MENPLCSIIVPVYNVEDYLERCIISLIGQDYDNIEIILVNDGSTDNSRAICDKYSKEDKRIVVFNKENGGLSSARNSGLCIAKGNYIFFVDSDDYVETSFCSSAMEIFKSNSKVDIVIFGFRTVSQANNKAILHQSDNACEITKQNAIKATLIDGYINNYAWNKAYRASLFKEIRYPIGFAFEDVGTTFKLFDRAEYLYIIPNITYNYIIRDNSISSKWWHSNKKLADYFNVRYDQFLFIKQKYPALVKEAYATTGFAAVMYDTYSDEPSKECKSFFCKKQFRKNNLLPYSLLFTFYNLCPKLSKKIIKAIFK